MLYLCSEINKRNIKSIEKQGRQNKVKHMNTKNHNYEYQNVVLEVEYTPKYHP